MADSLEKVEIKRVIGPTSAGAAVLLGNEKKTFVVFIGFAEAAAIMREIKNEPAERPMTHDLIQSLFLGFDLQIKQIIVSKIVDNAFCATLILEQKVTETNGEWVGRRNEVRIDARPSDCFVLALKNQVEIYVTEEVFEQVQDFSEMNPEGASVLGGEWGGLEVEGSGGEEGEEFFERRQEGFPSPPPEEEEEDDDIEQ